MSTVVCRAKYNNTIIYGTCVHYVQQISTDTVT